jgi:BTB/POZ domain
MVLQKYGSEAMRTSLLEARACEEYHMDHVVDLDFPLFCDVTLVVASDDDELAPTQNIHCHRLILQTYFESFVGDDLPGGKTKVPPGVDYESLRLLIHWAYYGIVYLNTRSTPNMERVGKLLGFIPLLDHLTQNQDTTVSQSTSLAAAAAVAKIL